MKVYMDGVIDISEAKRSNETDGMYERRVFDNSVVQSVGVINSLLEENVYTDNVSDEDKKVISDTLLKIMRSSVGSSEEHCQPVYDGNSKAFVVAVFNMPPTSNCEISMDENGHYIEV